MTDKDTDMAQLGDMAEFREHAHSHPPHNRRASDRVDILLNACPKEDCPSVFFLERRIDRHRDELNTHMEHIEDLKVMVKKNGEEVAKNSADTSQILEIVTTAKSFFGVVGWIGEKIQTILAIVGAVAAVIGYFKFKG
jgi:hypothetical protein